MGTAAGGALGGVEGTVRTTEVVFVTPDADAVT
jgi:hypothetical protein